MISQERLNRALLEIGQSKDITEATSREDYLFACTLGVGHRGTGVYLRCADAGHELTAGTDDEAIGFKRSGTKICCDLRE